MKGSHFSIFSNGKLKGKEKCRSTIFLQRQTLFKVKLCFVIYQRTAIFQFFPRFHNVDCFRLESKNSKTGEFSLVVLQISQSDGSSVFPASVVSYYVQKYQQNLANLKAFFCGDLSALRSSDICSSGLWRGRWFSVSSQQRLVPFQIMCG